MPLINIDYGYDCHSIKITDEQYQRFKAGKIVRVAGHGFQHEEDGLQADHWVFNGKTGEVMFWLDNEAEFYAQSIQVT